MKTSLIHSDPSVMMGKPVIVGTRMTVELLLEKMAAGETVEMILVSSTLDQRSGVSSVRLCCRMCQESVS